MCRNIKPLYNYDPPATKDDAHNAALQFVRKISGYHTPSQVNQKAFDRAVEQITKASIELLDSLETSAPPNNRAAEEAAARKLAKERFGR